MFPIEFFRAPVERFAALLEELSIRDHLTGDIASVAWGQPCLNMSIDVVIDEERLLPCLDTFLPKLRDAGFSVQEHVVRVAIDEMKPFRLLDPAACLLLKCHPHGPMWGTLSRSVMAEVFPGRLLPIVGRCDAALLFLERTSRGSRESRQDLRSILDRLSTDEMEFVLERVWKTRLEDLLEEVLMELDTEWESVDR